MYRRLTLIITTLALLSSLLAIYALQFLPEDPLNLRRNLTLYCIFVLIVSGLGLHGAVNVSLSSIQPPPPTLPGLSILTTCVLTAHRTFHKPLRITPPARLTALLDTPPGGPPLHHLAPFLHLRLARTGAPVLARGIRVQNNQ